MNVHYFKKYFLNKNYYIPHRLHLMANFDCPTHHKLKQTKAMDMAEACKMRWAFGLIFRENFFPHFLSYLFIQKTKN